MYFPVSFDEPTGRWLAAYNINDEDEELFDGLMDPGSFDSMFQIDSGVWQALIDEGRFNMYRVFPTVGGAFDVLVEGDPIEDTDDYRVDLVFGPYVEYWEPAI